MTTQYEAGKNARLSGAKSDANPHRGEVVRGIQRYMAGQEQDGSDWAVGWRDQNDSMSKQFPAVSSFRRKQNRYYK
jgi:hypothetical protein